MGGTGEILEHEGTGLTFTAGDASDLAQKIECLADDSELRTRLAGQAQERVIREFDFKRMIERLESFLSEALSDVRAAGQRAWSQEVGGQERESILSR